MFNYQKRNAPLRRTVTIEEIGNTALYLLSDLGSAVTGEVHHVDSGYNIMAMPRLDELKAARRARTTIRKPRSRRPLPETALQFRPSRKGRAHAFQCWRRRVRE